MGKQGQKGFTLIELVITVVLIASIITGIALGIQHHTANARAYQAEQDTGTLFDAVEHFTMNHAGGTTGVSCAGLSGFGVPTAWITDSCANDNPWGGSYAVSAAAGGTEFNVIIDGITSTTGCNLLVDDLTKTPGRSISVTNGCPTTVTILYPM